MHAESVDEMRDHLKEIIAELPEDRLRALLHYVEYLAHWEEQDAWSRFGLQNLAKAYSDDEPEYTLADIID